jgi:hypothetical protein
VSAVRSAADRGIDWDLPLHSARSSLHGDRVPVRAAPVNRGCDAWRAYGGANGSGQRSARQARGRRRRHSERSRRLTWSQCESVPKAITPGVVRVGRLRVDQPRSTAALRPSQRRAAQHRATLDQTRVRRAPATPPRASDAPRTPGLKGDRLNAGPRRGLCDARPASACNGVGSSCAGRGGSAGDHPTVAHPCAISARDGGSRWGGVRAGGVIGAVVQPTDDAWRAEHQADA